MTWRLSVRASAAAIALFVILTSCVIDDGGGTSLPPPDTSTTSGLDDGDLGGIVRFSTWAEDAFEENAYFEVVEQFQAETGVQVEMDLTVNDASLEDLGR